MAKPVVLPRWATDQTNNTAPSSGQADTGWTTNQVAVSSYFNYLGFYVYKWLEFLDPLFTSAGGFLAALHQSITVQGTGSFNVSGTGKYKHTDLKVWINPVDFQPTTQAITYVRGDNVYLNDNGNVQTVSSRLPSEIGVGKRVTGLVAKILASSNVGTRRVELSVGDLLGGQTSISSDTDTGVSSVLTLTLTTALPYTVTDFPHNVEVQLQDDDTLLGVQIMYDNV